MRACPGDQVGPPILVLFWLLPLTTTTRPESPFVVFYGEPSESQDTELKGKIVLTTPEPISVKSIRITLTGTRKVAYDITNPHFSRRHALTPCNRWHLAHTVSQQPISQKSTFLVDTVNVFPVEGSNKSKPHKINAGHHEWDFCFTLPHDLDESVEGLHSNYVVYDLKASVDKGYMSKHITATSHIRVIRTLGRDLLDIMPTDQVNEDIWANKLAYKITIPQKNFIVGSQITADFVLIPLKKGVEISTIKMELVEARQLFADIGGRRLAHQHEIQVATTVGDKPENSAHMVPEGVENTDEMFDESHRFTMKLDLPKSLKDCRQSVDTEHIRLHHRLRIYINMKNPEGHTSQLLVKNYVNLFISPNLPPNEDQSVIIDRNILNAQAIQDEANQNAPPTYGLHQLDQLYNDIDPSGFMTPGGNRSRINSGTNTPFYHGSHSGSTEDLTSMDAAAQATVDASAAALQHRLQNLDMSINDRSSLMHQGHYSSGSNTPGETHLDYDMDALARTPSYNTAVRTPLMTPVVMDMELPSYELATSRPTSPSRSRSSRATTPSPVRSLATLNEETYRNTQINSQRASPRTSDDGR